MKKIILSCLTLCLSISGFAEPIPADSILEFVRTKLPNEPLKLTGTLKVRTKNGFTKANLPVEMELDWGATKPTANYRIGSESLQITWNQDVPNYTFSNEKSTPTSNILDTGFTWGDLSFSVLWWPNSKLIDEDKKFNRPCYVIDVPIPGSTNTMRLWIDKKMGMLFESETLDAKKETLRSMKIISFKKMENIWIVKDLKIADKITGNTTILKITDLEWKAPEPTAIAFDPTSSINQLTFDLYTKISSDTPGNLFLSPYSISSALAMVYGGARGKTATEMEATLHYGGQGATHPAFSYLRKKLNGIQEKGHVQIRVANSLWPQEDYTFLPDYLALTKEFYGSEIEAVNFKTNSIGARKKINQWVEDKTNNRIKDLIEEGTLNSTIRLVLANAIYFKGNWAHQFKAERTRPAPFKLADGSSVEVATMIQNASFKLAHAKNFQALELPYEGKDLSMLVLLPTDSAGLSALEKSLTPKLISALTFKQQKVMVQLPKFKIESAFGLGDTLAKLGMPLAFSNQADFSGMNKSGGLFIDAVAHKAFIEVNEEGTEAAAATSVSISKGSMPPMFEANHPFVFLIRENSTGTILFIGRITDPR